MNNQEKLLNHLEESKSAVWLVSRWLSDKGYKVSVNPTFKSPSPEQNKDYVDNGDLEVSMRVEVKCLSINFTCYNDWPYGKSFIVCAKNAYDRAKPKPYCFIYLNQTKTHVAFVKGDTYPEWYINQRRDNRYNGDYIQDFYFIPTDQVIFSKL